MEKIRLRIITQRNDGCFVQIEQLPDGKLKCQLISHYFGDLTSKKSFKPDYDFEIVNVEKDGLFDLLVLWHDW